MRTNHQSPKAKTNQPLHSLSFIRIHSLCLSFLVLILINSLYLSNFEKNGLVSPIDFFTNTLALLIYFSIPVVANHMKSLGAHTADGKRQMPDGKRQTVDGRQ